MKVKLCFLLLGMTLMLGCSAKARLYPVAGPLSAQTPLPVLFPKFTGAFRSSGTISVVVSDGEVCQGHWAMVKVPKGAKPDRVPVTNEMQSAWDTVYGSGFYVSHVLGTRLYAQGVASGDRGTVLKVEMYKPGNGHEDTRDQGDRGAKGVAKDNQNNVYKLVW